MKTEYDISQDQDSKVFFDEKMQNNLRNIFNGNYHLVEEIDNNNFLILTKYFVLIENYVRSNDFNGSLDDLKYFFDHPKIISDFYYKKFIFDFDIEKQNNFYDFFICNFFSRILNSQNRDL